jgi:hypothetical protein
MSHIKGKVYDLTAENMNEIIHELEFRLVEIAVYKEEIAILEIENTDFRNALIKASELCLEPINTGDICEAREQMEYVLSKHDKKETT